MPRALVLRPAAKINLTLHVGMKLENGFHDVRTLMQAIGVSDTLTFSARRGPFALLAHGPGVPTDHGNLVWRAADALWRAAGRPGEPRDAHVRLEKTIPLAAGLGGGSADAAAALLGLNAVWELRLPRRQLSVVASTLGADVPYFLQGGTALGVGRGDEVYPVDDIARLGVVVIKPSFGVSTADAYRWLDEDRAKGIIDAPVLAPRPESPSRPQPLAQDVEVGWVGGPIALVNDLQIPVARRHPGIDEMIEACRREGAIAAAMTGSGSAVYGLFSEAVAAKAAKRLQRPDWLVLLTRTLSRTESGRRLGL